MQTFVSNLDEQTKSLSRLEFQAFCDDLTEIFCSCTRLNFERVVSVVWEVDFM